jgi:hypothetical protein
MIGRGKSMKSYCLSRMFVIKLALLCLFGASIVGAQTAQSNGPTTDAEKIADALRAGPKFITENATILDWPTTKGGEYRILRKGTNE